MEEEETFLLSKSKSNYDVELQARSPTVKSSARRIRKKRELIEQILVEERKHFPFFTYAITFVDLVMMIIELVYGGIVPFKENFWVGPSANTLITLGAKDAVLMMPKYGGHQFWRFITPMFLHVGILHFLLNMIAQIPIGRELERTFGSLRVAFVYLVSGIAGNLLSVLFLPRQIEVGASSSLYGWISIYIVDYIVNWRYYRRPGKQIALWSIGAIVSLALGLLPGVDNFAHIGGSIAGAFAMMIVLPRVFEVKESALRWAMIRGLGSALLFFYFAFGFAVFYDGIDINEECSWCKYTSCLPYWKSWCD